MTIDLDSIPDRDEAASGVPRTRALSDLGGLARRRTVLRGIALAGATVGATALGVSPFGRDRAAWAETSPSGLSGWDATDCRDAYPRGYSEQRDNVGTYMSAPAACYGGYRMGSTMCDSTGWHRADTERISSRETRSYRPISSACGATTTKNAWKWTVNGVTYRCSDGSMSIRRYGVTWYTYLTICRSIV